MVAVTTDEKQEVKGPLQAAEQVKVVVQKDLSHFFSKKVATATASTQEDASSAAGSTATAEEDGMKINMLLIPEPGMTSLLSPFVVQAWCVRVLKHDSQEVPTMKMVTKQQSPPLMSRTFMHHAASQYKKKYSMQLVKHVLVPNEEAFFTKEEEKEAAEAAAAAAAQQQPAAEAKEDNKNEKGPEKGKRGKKSERSLKKHIDGKTFHELTRKPTDEEIEAQLAAEQETRARETSNRLKRQGSDAGLTEEEKEAKYAKQQAVMELRSFAPHILA